MSLISLGFIAVCLLLIGGLLGATIYHVVAGTPDRRDCFEYMGDAEILIAKQKEEIKALHQESIDIGGVASNNALDVNRMRDDRDLWRRKCLAAADVKMRAPGS